MSDKPGMNGADFLLLVDIGTPEAPAYKVVGGQRAATVDETTASIDVSSKDNLARRVIPGRYQSSVSLDALYIPDDEAYQALVEANRQGKLIKIVKQEFGDPVEMADAVVTSISGSFPDQGECEVSVSLYIDGEWEPVGS